ncbi:preprotein translocase subunit YajC [Lachnospiraceae bacterium 45-P1]
MSPLLLFGAYGVLVFLAMYLFIYIPNKKKQRKIKELHDSIVPGDVVITIGGIVGTVVKREGEYVTLLADKEKDVTIQVVLYAIGQIKEKKA